MVTVIRSVAMSDDNRVQAARAFPDLIPRPSAAAVATAVVLIACALLGRAIYCVSPVNSDTAMFVYAGKLVAGGGRPGVDLIDNKLPSVGLLMSVPYRLLGAHWWAYGVLGLAMSIVATLILARSVHRTLGPAAALVAGVASCVWLNFTPAVYGQLQLETVTLFFAAIAGSCAIEMFRRYDRRDALTFGLCIGMGMWAKSTGAAILPAMVATILFATGWAWQKRASAVCWIAIGAALPIALCVWLIIITGMADALPATIAQLRDYSTASTFDLIDACKPAIVLGLLLFPMLVLRRIFRRDAVESCATQTLWIFSILWLLSELAGVIAQRRMYAYHFIVLGPPAAVLVCLIGHRLRPLSLLMAFGPPAAITATWAVMQWMALPPESRDDRVIAYLRDHVDAGQPVWVDDYPRLLVETDLRPGSGIPLIFLFANSVDSPRRFGQQIVTDFDQRKPAMIVLPSDTARVVDLYRHHMAEAAGDPARGDAIEKALGDIDRYVAAHYQPERSIEGRTFWRRNSEPAATVNLPRE